MAEINLTLIEECHGGHRKDGNPDEYDYYSCNKGKRQYWEPKNYHDGTGKRMSGPIPEWQEDQGELCEYCGGTCLVPTQLGREILELIRITDKAEENRASQAWRRTENTSHLR